MRKILFALALSLALAACDDSTSTAPVDDIPGPPNAPRIAITVLTGTKAAPVDSPTVKVQWWYKDSIGFCASTHYARVPIVMNYLAVENAPGISSRVFKIECGGLDSVKFGFGAAQYLQNYEGKIDSVTAYCK